MKQLVILFAISAILIWGLSLTGCKKREDLTPPLFKHTKWQYLKVETGGLYDSVGKFIGPVNDTTSGTAMTAILRKDDRQIIFRGFDYYTNTKTDSTTIFERTVFDSDQPSGKIYYYWKVDSVYAEIHYNNGKYSNDYRQIFEYWSTVK